MLTLAAFLLPGLAGRSADPEPPRDRSSETLGLLWVLICAAAAVTVIAAAQI